MSRLRIAVAALICGCICIPAQAQGAPSVKLSAAFTPEHLGASTTLSFGFQISGTNGQDPPPLTDIDLFYPLDLGLATSGLGLATCQPAILRADGPAGCPLNSRMGYGTALVQVPIGPAIIQEAAQITLLAGPVQDGHLELLIHASGVTPIDADIVFSTLLLPAPAPFGGRLDVNVPLVASLPGAADVAVVSLSSTLGSARLIYHRRSHGRTIAYHPVGIFLPDSCPRGGFPFAADFGFQDGTQTSAHTVVGCPHRKPRSHAAR